MESSTRANYGSISNQEPGFGQSNQEPGFGQSFSRIRGVRKESLIPQFMLMGMTLLAVILGSVWLIFALLEHNKVHNRESNKCPQYACGDDPATTAEPCQEGVGDQQPAYAYREEGSKVICQKDESLKYKLKS